jgi:hypothetical protein
VRSAEPPISSGKKPASVSSAFCDALRVAMVSALASVSFSSASAFAWKSSGSSPDMRRRNTTAASGCWTS